MQSVRSQPTVYNSGKGRRIRLRRFGSIPTTSNMLMIPTTLKPREPRNKVEGRRGNFPRLLDKTARPRALNSKSTSMEGLGVEECLSKKSLTQSHPQ